MLYISLHFIKYFHLFKITNGIYNVAMLYMKYIIFKPYWRFIGNNYIVKELAYNNQLLRFPKTAMISKHHLHILY